MAESETQIANFALTKLGSRPILSIDDNERKGARHCKLHYAQARDEVLRRGRWNWATTRLGLTEDPVKPLWGFGHQHGIPTDFIRLISVNGHDVWETGRADFFAMEASAPVPPATEGEKRILTNYEKVRIKYVRRVTDTTLFDALFTSALATLLASKIARAMTGSGRKEAVLLGQFEEIELPTAAQVDGAEDASGENLPIYNALAGSALIRSRRLTGSSDVGLLPDDIDPFGIPTVDS